ncbi:cytochrome ubiquinol oxidase subunit I, partial [Cellulomonas sp.]|uniref:cytochrome ubiquinol oxidase subunit I n=1 Tax=Cellulomonas sp. TaxID=40001 RepID=UPI002D70E53C
ASWLSDPSTGRDTVVQGLDAVPADERPTTREVNTVHLAWDVMVGIGTLLLLLAVWYGVVWLVRRRAPRGRLFLAAVSASGVLAVLAMEAGWIVTEVGRQPWIVYEVMRVEDAATGNEGVWATFLGVVLLYLVLGTTTVLVLRAMSRRFRRQAAFRDDDTPYGPTPDGVGRVPDDARAPEPAAGGTAPDHDARGPR